MTEGLGKSVPLRAHHARAVHLTPPGADEYTRIGQPAKGVPLRVGFARTVDDLLDESATGSALEWERLTDGSLVADISLTSPGASAVRAGLRIGNLPDAALLRFKGSIDDTVFDATGHSVNEALARNIDAGDRSEAARTYWSPVVEGDSVVMEIELPRGVDPHDVRIAVPQVSHLVTSAANAFATPTTINRSGACEVDAMCSSGWGNQMNAVAEMIFSDGSGSYLCTGTLLADQDAGTSTPYFITANHCISSQAVASSLVTYWFYRSSACNSGAPGPYQQLTGGATLLYATSNTDTSFMRLTNTPPQGTYYAGWYAGATPSAGSGITALHHPLGDLLKYSQGTIGGYLTCTPPSGGGFSCSNASASGSTFYDVGWTRGITEPGSSGSGIFLGNGYLVGQLYGGSGDCTTPGDDAYGRFDVAYNAALKTWLSAPLALNVGKSGTGTGVVSSSPAGISCGGTCSASFAPGTSVTLNASASPGSIFSGWGGACAGTGTCTVAMSSSASVTASFSLSTEALSVSSSGGTVTSAPAGINCGSICSASFPFGSIVTLTATPSAGLVFNGWIGACGGSGACSLAMNGALSVAATYASATLTSVASNANPAALGQSVTFTATVGGGSSAGTVAFRDGTTIIGGCEAVTVSGNSAACTTSSLAAGSHSITAAYSGSTTYAASISTALTQTVLSTIPLDVTKSGAGAGVVTSAPAGLNCGATCSASFKPGTALTLGAAASGGSVFTGWSGGGCSAAAPCTIAPTVATTVDASFALLAGAPTALASPASLDFGAQSMQTTTPAFTVSVINAGTGTLTISTVSVSDAQYAQTNACTSLASGANCTVTLTFTPSVQATVTANLVVTTSAGTLTVPLTGVGERSLVTHYYQAILNRAPDAAGKAFWDGEATRMASLGADLREAYYVMAGDFFSSPEYQSYGKSDAQFVTDLYNTFFNRPPDSGGLTYWLGQISDGMPRDVALLSFMFSGEFNTFTTGIFGNTAARPEVNMVMDFFRGVLNRLPDTTGYNFWVGQLKTAQCQGPGAVYAAVNNISYAFIFGPEYTGRSRNNTQFVTDMYNAFLRRGGDTAGVLFWVNQLNTGALDRNGARGQFIASPEFGARVTAVTNAGCLP